MKRVTGGVGGTGRLRNSRPWQTGQLLRSGGRRWRLGLGGQVGLRRGHRCHRGLVVRRRHGPSVVVRLDRHDGVGPDLTQLPLLLPPLPLPGKQTSSSSSVSSLQQCGFGKCVCSALWYLSSSSRAFSFSYHRCCSSRFLRSAAC